MQEGLLIAEDLMDKASLAQHTFMATYIPQKQLSCLQEIMIDIRCLESVKESVKLYQCLIYLVFNTLFLIIFQQVISQFNLESFVGKTDSLY